jgi:MFS family permease
MRSLRRVPSGWAAAVAGSPTVAAVSVEALLTRFGFGMVSFALPLYAIALGMNLGEVGLLYTARTATTVLVKPLMGWAADRYGPKSTLIVAILLRALVGLVLIFSTAAWQLFLVRFLQGVMTAARDPSATTLIAVHSDTRKMAATFAWYGTAREVGQSLGIGAAGLVIGLHGGYTTVFVVAFLTSCAGLLTVLRYVREHPPAAMASARSVAGTPASRPAYWRLLPYASFGLMVAGTAEMMKGFFPVIATQYAHLTEAEAGIAASVSTLAFLAAGPGFGWVSDHISRHLALGARSIANALSSLLYVALPSFFGFTLARVVDDTGKAAFKPTWGALLSELSAGDPARRARTITYVDSAYTLGEVIGPVVAGLLIGWWGVPAMLGVRAAIGLLAEAQAFALLKWAPLSAQRGDERRPSPVRAPPRWRLPWAVGPEL